MNGKTLTLLTALLVLASSVGSLPQDIAEDLAPREEVSLEHMALAAGLDANTFDEILRPEDPVGALRELNLSPGNGAPGEPGTAGQLAHLIIRLYHLRTGLMYHLFPGPHYALVECQRYGLLPEHLHARSHVSGAQVIQALEGARELAGGESNV